MFVCTDDMCFSCTRKLQRTRRRQEPVEGLNNFGEREVSFEIYNPNLYKCTETSAIVLCPAWLILLVKFWFSLSFHRLVLRDYIKVAPHARSNLHQS